MGVAVVLHHPGEGDRRPGAPVEEGEALLLEGAGNLDGAVTPEVVEHHRIAVFDASDGLASIGNDKLRQILIDGAGVAGTQAIHGSGSVGKLWSLAQHMVFPALLNHRPVGIVAVHGDVHAAAAGGDLCVKTTGADVSQEAVSYTHLTLPTSDLV